ncbi:MAG: GAF domain-containing protein, partial [Candidatus Methylomirabilota bacterium]
MDRLSTSHSNDPAPPRRPEPAGLPPAPDLEQAIWRQFAEATTPEAFYRSWLAIQARLLGGVLGGVVVLGPPGTGPYAPAALWPEGREVSKTLAGAAEQALADRRGLVIPGETTEGGDQASPTACLEVAYPILVAGQLHGVAAFEIRTRPERELQTVMRQIQWGAAWLELLWLRQEFSRSGIVAERLQTVLDLTATALSQERFHGAATSFVTAVATGLQCDRVSVGFLRGGRIRVRSMSHSTQVGVETNLIRAIAAAMEEAIDQQETVVHPSPPDGRPQVARAHADLARQHGAGAICTVPLCSGERVVGALTLERTADQPFERTGVELTEAVAALAGPVLDIQRREDRWLVTKAGASIQAALGQVIGPGRIVLKLSLVAVAVLAAYLATAVGEYRVSATAALEPVVRRAVTAPFAGYIGEAPVRAGDLVRQGTLLASLDDRDLRLQRIKWGSQLEQLARQHQQALALRNAAQTTILAAQMDQARAELSLLDDQLARSRLRSPI